MYHHHHHTRRKICMILELTIALSALLNHISYAQEPYTQPIDCNAENPPQGVYGYSCKISTSSPSCKAYAVFFTGENIENSSILLNVSSQEISSLNKLTETEKLQPNTPLLVPLDCSCNGSFSQAQATYTVRNGDVYATVASTVYEGLTTCQAMIAQNTEKPESLDIGDELTVPLRCACPRPNSTFQYMVTYPVQSGDSLDAIAALFHVSEEDLLLANQLDDDSDPTIFPATTLLIPLHVKPSPLKLPPSPPPPMLVPSMSPPAHKKSSHVALYVGIVVVVCVLLLVVIFAVACFVKRLRSKPRLPEAKKFFSDSTYDSRMAIPDNLLQHLGESGPQQYSFNEISMATRDFDEGNRLGHSVHIGDLDGNKVVVKRVNAHVADQLRVLSKLNHVNLVSFIGFCVANKESYLVFEYVENGSLEMWLKVKDHDVLSWKQRVQIAVDIAHALNYLHNYTKPSYVHADVNTHNVVLDSGMRAKVTNFGEARIAGVDGKAVMTRHVVGTRGYMAPEYLESGMVTPMLDVFSFGVVMAQLMSGKDVTFSHQGKEMMVATYMISCVEKHKFKEFMDPSLVDYPHDSVVDMTNLACACVSIDLNSRPSMDDIIIALSRLL